MVLRGAGGSQGMQEAVCGDCGGGGLEMSVQARLCAFILFLDLSKAFGFVLHFCSFCFHVNDNDMLFSFTELLFYVVLPSWWVHYVVQFV